jgi:hypothetical protein
MIIVDDVVSVISNIPLKDALIYLTANGISNYLTKGYDKIKKVIVDKQNEGKYAFVPNKEEVLFLEQAEKSPNYQQILILVPNYKYIDLIRTGLLLKEYNRKIDAGVDSEQNRQQISRIKLDIIRRPGGGRLLKIVKLPSSNFFPIILSYLYELKIHGYPESQLEEEFNELVEEWERCSKFVDNENSLEEVLVFCGTMIKDNNTKFFLLALYENQIGVVEKAIKKLDEEQIMKNNNYLTKIEKEDRKGITPRIEVMFFKDPSIL